MVAPCRFTARSRAPGRAAARVLAERSQRGSYITTVCRTALPPEVSGARVVSKPVARKAASIANAEAEAEKARLTGEGEKSRRSALAEAEAIEGAKRGEAEKARRVAEADAVRAEGEAHGAAILAAGQAEAEAMDKKAAAFAGYNEAAVLQMLIEVMPKVAAELARPMASIDKLTVISADGAGELPKQVTNNFVQTMELLKTTTGLDVEQLIQKYARTTEPATVPAGLADPAARPTTD